MLLSRIRLIHQHSYGSMLNCASRAYAQDANVLLA